MNSIEELQAFINKGGINTMFVIEAVNRYSKEIISKEAELRKLHKNWFINPEEWINCAKECNNLTPS